MQDSHRINRIHVPSIDITFRGEVALRRADVWREDRLLSVLDDVTYLVLDFGVEERVEFMQAELAEEDQDWRSTGKVMIELQRIDPDTGDGLANAQFKEIAGDEGAVIAWYGWQLEPCSPRRPTAHLRTDLDPTDLDEDEPVAGERCLMCGSTDVVYHDADGTPRCASHVGESPPAPDDEVEDIDSE